MDGMDGAIQIFWTRERSAGGALYSWNRGAGPMCVVRSTFTCQTRCALWKSRMEVEADGGNVGYGMTDVGAREGSFCSNSSSRVRRYQTKLDKNPSPGFSKASRMHKMKGEILMWEDLRYSQNLSILAARKFASSIFIPQDLHFWGNVRQHPLGRHLRLPCTKH